MLLMQRKEGRKERGVVVDDPFEKMCLAKVSRAVDLLSGVGSLELGQLA